MQLALDGLQREHDELACDKADLLRELQALIRAPSPGRVGSTQRREQPTCPPLSHHMSQQGKMQSLRQRQQEGLTWTELRQGKVRTLTQKKLDPRLDTLTLLASENYASELGSSVARREIRTSSCGWLILKKLPKTVNGQMNCEQGGSHGSW